MKTKPFAILLVVLCTLLTSIGLVLFKKASAIISFNIFSIITNLYLIIGFIIYALASLILIYALKNGELSVLYPFMAMSYIWTSFFSIQFLSETMTGLKWAGVACIIIGVSIVGLGGKK